MKKSFKSICCLFLSIMLVLSFAFGSFAYTNTAEAQRFNEDGTFRIMHVTDTHLEYYNLEASVYLIAAACDREKPDMIALTGDIAMSDDKEEMDTCIDRLMTVFEERNIPVALCFGNHDIETKSYTNPSDLMALYNSYDCSISVDEGDVLTGCGTYNIPILASDSDEMKFNVWVFDSGSTDGEGHYSNVPADQVAYRNKSKTYDYKEAVTEECRRLLSKIVRLNDVVPYVVAAGYRRYIFDILLTETEKYIIERGVSYVK